MSMTLAWWLIRAQFRTRRAATLLSMLAIALGVALGYAIHLINDAALADFSRAMKTVQGDPDAVIAARDSAGSVPLATVNEHRARPGGDDHRAGDRDARAHRPGAHAGAPDRHRRLQRRGGDARLLPRQDERPRPAASSTAASTPRRRCSRQARAAIGAR
jgi:hypothetical protein